MTIYRIESIEGTYLAAQVADLATTTPRVNQALDPNGEWSLEAAGADWYSINNRHTSLALQLASDRDSDGAIEQAIPTSEWRQHWQVTEYFELGTVVITCRANGQALDAGHRGLVCVRPYHGGESQHWRLLPVPIQEHTCEIRRGQVPYS
jgi:Ricin-type beta-trefoil lectin domain-like